MTYRIRVEGRGMEAAVLKANDGAWPGETEVL